MIAFPKMALVDVNVPQPSASRRPPMNPPGSPASPLDQRVLTTKQVPRFFGAAEKHSSKPDPTRHSSNC